MTIAPVNSAAGSTDAVSLGRNRLAQNFDTFLTLLTTQMRNQDPLAPLDSNQFTAQLVQMTGVEQQLATNDLLKQLVANTGSDVGSAVNLIGKQVRVDSADAKLSGGKAQWNYHLDADTSDVKIEVLNSAGATVDVAAADAQQSKAGDHAYVWDGRGLSGQALPDGVYTLRITTRDASGASIAAGSVYLEGPVSAVERSGGDTLLTINGARAPLSSVIAVTQLPNIGASNSSSASDTSTPAGQTPASAA